MKKFPTILKSILWGRGEPAQTIADRMGISGATLSRLAAGISDPDTATLSKLLPIFPQDARKHLIAAWIEDQAQDAGITPAEVGDALGSADGLHVPEGLRRSLSLILARAGDAPEFAQAMASLAACLVDPQDRDNFMKGNPFPEAQAVPLHEVAEGTGPDVSKLPRKPAIYKKARKPKR